MLTEEHRHVLRNTYTPPSAGLVRPDCKLPRRSVEIADAQVRDSSRAEREKTECPHERSDFRFQFIHQRPTLLPRQVESSPPHRVLDRLQRLLPSRLRTRAAEWQHTAERCSEDRLVSVDRGDGTSSGLCGALLAPADQRRLHFQALPPGLEMVSAQFFQTDVRNRIWVNVPPEPRLGFRAPFSERAAGVAHGDDVKRCRRTCFDEMRELLRFLLGSGKLLISGELWDIRDRS